MQKTTIVCLVFGVIIAAAFAGVLDCIGELDAPWCDVFTIAQDKYEEINGENSKATWGIDGRIEDILRP